MGLSEREKQKIYERTNYSMGDTLSGIVFPIIDEVLADREGAQRTPALEQPTTNPRCVISAGSRFCELGTKGCVVGIIRTTPRLNL
jgi:hypothetical protein